VYSLRCLIFHLRTDLQKDSSFCNASPLDNPHVIKKGHASDQMAVIVRVRTNEIVANVDVVLVFISCRHLFLHLF
jgi:hypothetical protein